MQVLQSGNLDRRLGVSFEEAPRVAVPSGTEGRRTRVQRGDVLVCITGALTGNVGLVDVEPEEAYVNQHLALARPRQSAVEPGYLALGFASTVGALQFDIAQYGGTKQGLGLEDIRTLVIAIPPRDEQTRIWERVSRGLVRLRSTQSTVEQQLDRLREYRQALITAAVTGQLAIPAEPA